MTVNCRVNVTTQVRARASLTVQLTMPLIIHRYGLNRASSATIKDKGYARLDIIA